MKDKTLQEQLKGGLMMFFVFAIAALGAAKSPERLEESMEELTNKFAHVMAQRAADKLASTPTPEIKS